ncbi:MAG: hypothetical protein HYS34_01785 [Acidobacteria bacterium]|nr:hypothetical protein [Acidobacteriota bacterium]
MRWGVLLLVFLALPTGNARALTDEEIFRDFRFNFISPGARAMGLGGAFIAAADDATAAQANPAALHYVTKNEFFLEYRETRPASDVFTPSQTIGDISDPVSPTLPFLRLQAVTSRGDNSLPTFASFVIPFKMASRRAVFAVSRQMVLDVQNSLRDDDKNLETDLRFSISDFPIWVNPNPADPLNPVEQYTVSNEVNGGLRTELVHYNLGLSYSFLADFSLGVTATVAALDMASSVLSTSQDPRGILTSTNPRIDTGGALSPIQTRTVIDDSDSALTYTVGLHWHPDRAFFSGYSPLRFGIVYRKGARLSVTETRTEFDVAAGEFVVNPADPPFENVLREPDRFGVGMSYAFGQHWTFAFDAERIAYSDLLEDYRPGVNFFTSGLIPATFLNINAGDLEFDVEDATVLHGGAEFFFGGRGGWRYALRGGYYNAPDNRIRLTNVASGSAEIDGIFRDVFRGGRDLSHYTGGISINSPAGIQMQLAADFADSGNEYLVSAIYRFGKIR